MGRYGILLLGVVLWSGIMQAGELGNKQTLSGYLVDIACATDQTQRLIPANHSRKCLLMPACKDSGYALLTDEQTVLRFDQKGNELAAKFIHDHSRTDNWRITVSGSVEAGRLNVARIRLQ